MRSRFYLAKTAPLRARAKAAEYCRTPRRFAFPPACELPEGLGVRQSSAAFKLAVGDESHLPLLDPAPFGSGGDIPPDFLRHSQRRVELLVNWENDAPDLFAP